MSVIITGICRASRKVAVRIGRVGQPALVIILLVALLLSQVPFNAVAQVVEEIDGINHVTLKPGSEVELLVESYLTESDRSNLSYIFDHAIVPGFNQYTLARNDDGSTGLVNIGFTVNFFGLEFDRLYVNNNGNVTFDVALHTYTPFDLTTTGRRIIAPFFADVDTRFAGNPVTYGYGTFAGRNAFGVNWIDVDYYYSSTSHTNRNSFQLILVDRSDTGDGNFDIVFNYDQIQWETGTASGGDSNGRGGNSARAGYSNGTGEQGTFYELPGSAVNGAFLDGGPYALAANCQNSIVDGRYIYRARAGSIGTVPLLYGLVYHADSGAPIAGAEIIAGADSTSSDTQGRFQLDNLSSGEYSVTVSATGYHDLTRGVTIENNPVHLVFDLIPELPPPPRDAPRILSVRSPYSGPNRAAYFLHGVNFSVTFDAQVDWQGNPPGQVRFLTPTRTVTAADGRAVLNVGSDFGPGGTLTVQAVSAEGLISDPYDAGIVVMSNPPSILTPTLVRGNSSYYYRAQASLAGPLLGDETDPIDSDIPFFGGARLGFYTYLTGEQRITADGFNTYYPKIDLSAPSSGLKVLDHEVPTKFFLGGKAVTRYNAASGDWHFDSGHLVVEMSARQNIGPVYTVIYFVPFYLRGSLTGSLNTQLGITGLTEETFLWSGNMSPGLRGEVAGGVGAARFISGEAYLGATGSMHFRYPETPTFHRAELIVDGGARLYALFYRQEWEGFRYTWAWTPAQGESYRLLHAFQKPPDFEPVPRDYLERTSKWRCAQPSLMTAEDYPWQEVLLQSSVFPRSTPDLAALEDELLLLFIADDPEREDLNQTRLVYATSSGGLQFSEPQPVAPGNTTADFSPQVAALESGAVAAWQDIAQEMPPGSTLEEVLPHSEIAVARFDAAAGAWSTWQRLTDNDYLDYQPSLAASGDEAMLVWVANPDNDLQGGPDAPNRLYYSYYDGDAWSEPARIAEGLGAVTDASLAFDGDSAVYVFSLDADGDLSTLQDQELYAVFFDGVSWTGPVRLTDNEVQDTAPRLIYLPGGELQLLWYRDGDIVAASALDTGDFTLVAKLDGGANPADLRLVEGPGGQNVLLWTESTGDRQELFLAFFDDAAGHWSSPRRVATEEASLTHSPAAAYNSDGELVAVYNRVRMDTEEREVELPEGDIATVTVPVPLDTDLYALLYLPGYDLAVCPGSLTADPINPLPGEQVEISARVENRGEFMVQDISVAFFEGDPGAGGEQLGTSHITGPLRAGESAAVSLEWTLPAGRDVPRVYVVVDPGEQHPDRNRANNAASFPVSHADLAVTHLVTERMGPSGRVVTVTVDNLGGVSVPQSVVEVYRGEPEDGELLNSVDVGLLEPGGRAEVGIVIQDLDTQEEELLLTALITPIEEIEEYCLENNFRSVLINLQEENRVATPVALPTPGPVEQGILVSLGSSTHGAEIYYTLNGDDPDQESSRYEEPIALENDMIIKAIAYKESLAPSRIAEFVYTVAELVYGDVNGNGEVDVGDAILVLRHIVGLIDIGAVYGFEALVRARVSGGEGEPDVGDAILILRHVAGLITEFPVESLLTVELEIVVNEVDSGFVGIYINIESASRLLDPNEDIPLISIHSSEPYEVHEWGFSPAHEWGSGGWYAIIEITDIPGDYDVPVIMKHDGRKAGEKVITVTVE